MRYWALKYTSLFIKGLAVVAGILSLIAYFMALFGGAAFFDSLQLFGMRVGLNTGFMTTFLISTCGLMLMLSSCVITYAAGQYLDLLISIEENVIGLRHDVRSRRARAAVPKSTLGDWEQQPPEQPTIRIRDQRRPLPYKDERSRWYRSSSPSVEHPSTFDESKIEYRPDPRYVEYPTTFRQER